MQEGPPPHTHTQRNMQKCEFPPAVWNTTLDQIGNLLPSYVAYVAQITILFSFHFIYNPPFLEGLKTDCNSKHCSKTTTIHTTPLENIIHETQCNIDNKVVLQDWRTM